MPESIGAMPERSRFHAVVMSDPEGALAVVRRLRATGHTVSDVQSPFPIHGLDEAMGLKETRIPGATLVGGVFGLLLAIGFQAWVGVASWPLNIGGKSDLALPALAPVTFEVAVLLAAFSTVGALFYLSGLRPGPRSDLQVIPGSSDDCFVVVVREADAGFDHERFRQLAGDAGAVRVMEGWAVR
jgi:hypothetical protein